MPVHPNRTQQLDTSAAIPSGRKISALSVGRQNVARLGPQIQAQFEDTRGTFAFRHVARYAQVRSLCSHG